MKIKITAVFFVLVSVITSPSLQAKTQDCGDGSQSEMNACSCSEAYKEDQKLNQLYQTLLKQHADDPILIKKMKAAERAWIRYRDAQLEMHFPDPDKRNYGSVFRMCQCTVESSLTEARYKELKEWSDEVTNGDICWHSPDEVK